MSTLFISHSSSDNAAAQELQQRLEQQGHRSIFLDFDPDAGIQAGVSWERTLYTKLRACRAVVALCSDSYLASQWCFAEVALARMEGKEIFVLEIEPRSKKLPMPSVLRVEQNIDMRKDPETGWLRLWNGFKLKGIEAAAAREWRPQDPPYPGLSAFGERDAPVFFGRDEEIREGLELLNRVRLQGHPRLVMVLGSSGSGKSSLVLAGIVPQLRRDARSWRVIRPFRPGPQPMRELSSAMSHALVEIGEAQSWQALQQVLDPVQADVVEPPARSDLPANAEAADTLRTEGAGLIDDARAHLLQALSAMQRELTKADDGVARSVELLIRYLDQARPADAPPRFTPPTASNAASQLVAIADRLRLHSEAGGSRIVLVIDQFEELLGHDPAHPASRFLAVLRQAVEVDDSPLLVLGTMRSDYLGAFQRSKPLQGLGFQSLSVGPMSIDGMRQVIEEPARLGQIALEKGLADVLLKDTDTPDALPLLAFTLRTMWDRFRGDRLLELREYRLLQGMQGAVALVAEETYRAALACAPSPQAAAALEQALRDAFLSMARPAAEGSGWSRQPATWEQFGADLQPVLQTFIDPQRLLILREGGTLEVAHEALFRSWARLKSWLDQNSDRLHLLQEVREQAKQWQAAADAQQKEPYLLRGLRLARAVELRQEARLPVQERERSFIDASEQAERALMEARERGRRSALRRTQAFALVLSLAFVAAFFAWREAEAQRQAAEQQRRMVLAAAHESDPLLGRLIVREVPGRPAGWTPMAADQVHIRVPQIHTVGEAVKDVDALSFGPDGRFASAHAIGGLWEIHVWEPDPDAGPAMKSRRLGTHDARVWDLSFSSSGQLLTSADDTGTVKIWNLIGSPGSAPVNVIPHPNQAALRVRLSRDGQLAAVLTQAGEDGVKAVTLWQLEGSAVTKRLVVERRGNHPSALALSPDGLQLLLGYQKGELESRSTQLQALGKSRSLGKMLHEVRQLTFDEAGLQWASADKQGHLWWQQAGELRRHKPVLQAGGFDPLGLRLVQGRLFAAFEKDIYLGTLAAGPGDKEHEVRPVFAEFQAVTISRADTDGRRLITALEGRDGLSSWDVRRPPEPRALNPPAERCASSVAMRAAYLPDGRLLAAYADGSVRVWTSLDAEPASKGGAPQARLVHSPAGADCGNLDLTALAVSPDGQRYATASRDGRILLGMLPTDRTAALPAERPVVLPAAASLKLQRATARTCELTQAEEGSDRKGDQAKAVWSLAFDPTSRSLLAGLQDGRVRRLDLDKRQWAEVGRHDGAVCSVDWARGGELVLSASLDQSARVWRLAGAEVTMHRNLPHASPVFTASFDPDGQRVLTGSEDTRLRVWDLAAATPVAVDLPGHAKSVRASTFSPDGTWVLSGGGNVVGLNCWVTPATDKTAVCEADKKLERFSPSEGAPDLQTVRAVAVSPKRPQFAVLDLAGEINLYRTDYRVALWQQQAHCLSAAARQRVLRETPKQAIAALEECMALQAACSGSEATCRAALDKAQLR